MKIPLKTLTPNPNNPRYIVEEKMDELKKSLKSFPKMMELRPMVVDDEGVILGGNMRYEALVALGYKTVPETWIKKASDLTEEEKKEFVIKDNLPFGAWDWETLANDWDEQTLLDWGLNIGEWIPPSEEDEADFYSQKIKTPVYEPLDAKPDINDLTDLNKMRKLISTIDNSGVTDEEKAFLRLAAMRHIVFDYATIADYYAHSENEMQSLMEKSALVIIDFKKAVENGFVHLSKTLANLYEKDYDDAE